MGKTNLLDAIHYLCFTKSYFTRQDALNTLHGYKGFRLEGNFDLQGHDEKAVCVVRETGKKEFSLNEQLYSRHRQSDRSHGKRGASAPHRRLVRTTTGAACHDRFTSRVPTSRDRQ